MTLSGQAKVDYQREYMRAYRRGERRTRVRPGVRPVRPAHVEEPKPPHVEPKAIYSSTTPLTKTHRFEIWAPFSKAVSPISLQHVVVRSKGKANRIQYAEVKLANSVIEIYGKVAKIFPTTELEGLDAERIQGMKDALQRACSFRGIVLKPESAWRVGEFSHTTMENEDLNDALRPLALREAGDHNYHLFADDGSHPGKVESAGKENWTGTNLLYHVLFQLPMENARQIAVFGENIKLHLSTLTDIKAGVGELTAAVRELRDVLKELKR